MKRAHTQKKSANRPWAGIVNKWQRKNWSFKKERPAYKRATPLSQC